MVDGILSSLGNPVSKNDLLDKINNIKPGDVDLNKVSLELNRFVNYFNIYLKEREFQKNIYRVIEISLEICENEEDLADILVKTAIVNLIDLYISYSDISAKAKESVLNILGASFGTLDPRAQVLNVCLMVDPVFKSSSYKETIDKKTEVEVKYKDVKETPNVELEVKQAIDVWIKQQQIDLERQNELEEGVKQQCKSLAEEKGLDISSREYQELEIACVEMMRMQMTSMALMFEFDDDDISPIPIN